MGLCEFCGKRTNEYITVSESENLIYRFHSSCLMDILKDPKKHDTEKVIKAVKIGEYYENISNCYDMIFKSAEELYEKINLGYS